MPRPPCGTELVAIKYLGFKIIGGESRNLFFFPVFVGVNIDRIYLSTAVYVSPQVKNGSINSWLRHLSPISRWALYLGIVFIRTAWVEDVRLNSLCFLFFPAASWCTVHEPSTRTRSFLCLERLGYNVSNVGCRRQTLALIKVTTEETRLACLQQIRDDLWIYNTRNFLVNYDK